MGKTVSTSKPMGVHDVADAQVAALAGIRQKLHRAETHLDSLDVEMRAFTDGMPSPLGDPQPRADQTELAIPLRLQRPMPLVWGVVLGEIVHDLRSALDHTIFQLTLDYTGKELERTGFPISDKADNWDQRGGPKTPDNPLGFAKLSAMYQIRGVGKGVVDYVKRLQPHSMPNPQRSALGALHLLWNQDKHRLLTFWGFQLVPETSELTVKDADRPYKITLATGLLKDGDVAITVTFDGPPTKGTFGGRLHTQVAFENPADPTPGVNDRLWRLHDATSGVVGTLMAAIGRQDDPIS
jgi:hypothetical protein